MNYDQCIERYHFLISEDSKSINLMHSMEILLLNLSSITEDFVNICVNIVWMCDLDHKESWVPKNWGFETAVLKTLESPLDQTSKEIKPVYLKGNQSWIFIGRTDAEAKAPILWPFDVKNWHIGKDPDAGKDWRQEEKGTTEDELVGWHHRLDGHEYEQTPGDAEGQESLECCSPCGRKELNTLHVWLKWLISSKLFNYAASLRHYSFFSLLFLFKRANGRGAAHSGSQSKTTWGIAPLYL